MGDVTGAIESRRSKAKELLLDVEEQFGSERMSEVVDVIKGFRQKSVPEVKRLLVDIFRGNRDFQQRFLEFLPRSQFRS